MFVHRAPFEFCNETCRNVFLCIAYRPLFSGFVCSLVLMIYLTLFSQKAQEKLASLPYEKYLSKFKSQKMITVYATVLEVALELLTAIVLAGVSIIVTFCLVFEEVADKKNNKYSKLQLKQADSFVCSPRRKSASGEINCPY